MQILKGFKQDQVSWTVRVDLNASLLVPTSLVKGISSMRLLVSLSHDRKESAGMQLFDVSTRMVKKSYSFGNILGGIIVISIDLMIKPLNTILENTTFSIAFNTHAYTSHWLWRCCL